MGVVGKVESSDEHGTLYTSVAAVGLRIERILETVATVSAHTQAQAGNREIVDPKGPGIGVSYLELVGATGTVVYPAFAVEAVGVESRQKHHLIAPLVAQHAPQTDARFVPRTGQYRVLPFGTVYTEELGGGVVHVGGAYRHDDVAQAQIEGSGEALLNPKLFECDFSASFDFRFIFSGFLLFDFDGTFGAAVFKLDFGTHAPTAAKVIAEEDDHMGQVETAVALALMQMGILVFFIIVAEKIARGNGFAISADGEAGFARFGHRSFDRRLLAEFFQNLGFQFCF